MVVSILLSTPVEKRNLLKSLSGCQTQFQRQNPLWVPMYDVEISQLFGICQMRGVKRRLLHQHENPFFSHSPHVSTRTSCSSMDLMGVSECTTSNWKKEKVHESWIEKRYNKGKYPLKDFSFSATNKQVTLLSEQFCLWTRKIRSKRSERDGKKKIEEEKLKEEGEREERERERRERERRRRSKRRTFFLYSPLQLVASRCNTMHCQAFLWQGTWGYLLSVCII